MTANIDRDCWSYWYPKKTGTIEVEIPKVEELLIQARSGHNKQKILDVGCGMGRHVLYFARKEFDVYGFDGSPMAIKAAKKDISAQNLSAELSVHDMTQPFQYQDGFFDCVIATRVIGHAYADEVRKIAGDMNRVLKTSGYLYVQVPSHEWEMKTIEENGGMEKVRVVDDMTHIPFEGPEKLIPHHHFTKEHLLELFPDYLVIEMHQGSEHYNGICFIGRKP